ncbi:MAG: DNA mismatch repair protein MutL [Halanaerobium sp. 4-GBenrich]|jgi:DNA mismatch repair protein MutL|uniref:DNA mismatch repair protein MutL n=1 Tax=Halanaerobium congolense TaxID=54121 RepID=A0A1G7FCR8_9FIRM|nr:DNA mismatch repair endonuclease MutL [Halanaerobium congolense]ODS50961.1 MAG: DNA mismatch repair protein MutL [Halanaerobium sp. 4-GBenrich]PTX17180.1 DNA mismatch repair protein MutL [Halanaerobium congolense]PXV69395.1 DNA mismatch repair protein MutL [Halanaerobium congolense]SDE73672.1 DNA mismatch repair protein MutL [Halanaerobium congolense]SDG84009.1 DNA mismatch repair protein MutL [Halanaerobium congolense]
MGVIKQLPQNVANQISAGEVIERPASIVKELIENSIDAGAKNIEIRIEDGGRELIKVKDDGHGILADDIESAFNRYATSKIEDIDDLYSLYSLGFRGEALASIVSVAEIEMISRHQDSDQAVKIKLKGGEIIDKKPVGSTIGTEITVRDLFYNTPARYKYLKTTTTEFSHISKIVSAEATANSDLSFKLFHDSRQILSTPGNGKLKDTIYAVFGGDIAENLIPIDIEDRYIKLSGYLCRPELTRSSRSHELFFVNGRPIYNNLTAKAVETAYSKLIDPGRKPIVFLFIKVNPILVDVNVHPAKKEVKFSRSQIIFDVIKKAVRNTLKENDPTTRIKIKKDHSLEADRDQTEENIERDQLFNQNKKSSYNSAKQNNYSKTGSYKQSKGNYQKNINYGDDKSYNPDLKSSENKKDFRQLIRENENQEYSLENVEAEESYFKFLGQIFNSYLLIETDQGLKIVDQHNAQERILYERFYAEYNKKDKASQSLLMPVKIELSAEEREIVHQYEAEIKKIGIDFSDFGNNTILIQEVPVLLKNMSTRNIIEELIAELAEAGKAKSAAEVQANMLEYLACRSSIKAGQPLTKNESIQLIKDLYKTENPYRCPHSRPVMINISREEIEKGLGRK